MRNAVRSLLFASTLLLICPSGICEEALGAEAPASTNIADLSIEELLNIKITSASKKVETVSQVSSAIYVISQEDIRRSGVTSIAEALRMAPGVNVAQGKSNGWAISARGFQSSLSNKLLVLIDGRTVYSPLYSGVYWDVQDTMLEDIERIEVIRGPGATVWGANAVNGVINVITKDSQKTQGGLVSASVGTSEHTIDSLRYGGKIGEKVTYRGFLKYTKREELSLRSNDNAAHDGSQIGRAGTRFDIKASAEDLITVEGDYYRGDYEEKPTAAILTPPFQTRRTNEATLTGGDVITRWSHSFSDSSETTLQLYYDRTERDELLLGQALDTIDLDFNHHFKVDRHEIVYGAGYRNVESDLDNTFSIQFVPNDRRTDLLSAFIQDEITVLNDVFSITIGSKFEHNDFTGFEVQPSIKTLWRAAKNHTVWSSISRAVRTSSPLETDLRANLLAAAPNILVSLLPDRNIPSESVISYELGHRAQLHKRFSIDSAGFYNKYDNLRSNEVGTPFPEATPAPAHVTLPVVQRAFVKGQTYGGEFAATWEPIDRLRISTGYSFLQILLHPERRSKAADAEIAEGQTPENQFHVRAFLDLPKQLQFDTAMYFVDRLESSDIPAYTRLDARLGWRPTSNLDVSIGAHNILQKDHAEFSENTSKIERNVYLKCTLSF